MIDIRRLRVRLRSFAESRTGKIALKSLRWLLISAIVGYLIYQLTEMGWDQLWKSIPTTPYFYIINLAIYVILPASEVFIYGRLWGMSAAESLPLTMRKRVLNADVVGYSGEFFLLAHARKRLNRATRTIAGEIKDNLILSSAASILVGVGILVGMLASGYVALNELLGDATPGYVALGGFAFLLVGGLAVRFRRTLFTLGNRTLGFIFSIHLLRFLLSNVLGVLQWWVVLPNAPFSAWATLLVLLVVTNRIPFIPSRDLVFAGVGIEASVSLGVPGPAVAGMLLTRSVIDRILNVGFFVFFTITDREGTIEVDADGLSDESLEKVDASAKAEASTESVSDTP